MPLAHSMRSICQWVALAIRAAFEKFRRQLGTAFQQLRVALLRAAPAHSSQQHYVDPRVLAVSNEERERRLRGVTEGLLAGETLRRFIGGRLPAFLQPLANSIKKLAAERISCLRSLPQPLQVAIAPHEKALPDHLFFCRHSAPPVLSSGRNACARSASTSRSALITCVTRSSVRSSAATIILVSASRSRRRSASVRA